MIISHKYKIIFIHIPKNAGTFITQLLHNLDENLNTQYLVHTTARKGQEIIDHNIWNNYTKFCVIRNSWDFSVSYYHYIKQSPQHQFYELIQNKTFDEFLSIPDIHFNQCYFVIDHDNNKFLVNYLIDFNNIENNLIKFFNNIIKIDLKTLIDAMPKSKINESKREKDYTFYYSKNTIELIYNIHNEDIRIFNLKFSESNNKNLYPTNPNDIFNKEI